MSRTFQDLLDEIFNEAVSLRKTKIKTESAKKTDAYPPIQSENLAVSAKWDEIRRLKNEKNGKISEAYLMRKLKCSFSTAKEIIAGLETPTQVPLSDDKNIF